MISRFHVFDLENKENDFFRKNIKVKLTSKFVDFGVYLILFEWCISKREVPLDAELAHNLFLWIVIARTFLITTANADSFERYAYDLEFWRNKINIIKEDKLSSATSTGWAVH